jgi:hypothetical protein
VSSYRTSAERKLAAAVLQEWLQLAWLLPREQRAAAFAAQWLQKRTVWGWREWLTQRRKWKQLGDSLQARWTNLHLAAAWQAWRSWVQGRQEKARLAATVAKRWNNLHLAAAFQAWVELVKVCCLARVLLLHLSVAAHVVVLTSSTAQHHWRIPSLCKAMLPWQAPL